MFIKEHGYSTIFTTNLAITLRLKMFDICSFKIYEKK